MIDNRIPWWAPKVGGEELELVREVLASQYINDGDVTARFEQEIARLVGARYAVAATSGTAALFLSLAALGIGHGDEVLVPDMTFIATANAVTLTGATPVLVDVDPATLNISVDAVARALTPMTRAVIPVHVSGRAADLLGLEAVCAPRRVAIVEDAAEAFTSTVGGRALGTIGALGCFSFSPNKTVTTGQGGVVVTNDDGLHVRLRELKDQGRSVRGTGGADTHAAIGFNFKLTNLQAAVGLAQLGRLHDRVARQRRTYRQYARALADVPQVCLPGFDVDGGEVPQWVDVLATRRDALDEYLLARGIECRRFWHPIHTQAPYRRPDALFPESTQVSSRALWLPSAFTLTDVDVETVCAEIRRFYSA